MREANFTVSYMHGAMP